MVGDVVIFEDLGLDLSGNVPVYKSKITFKNQVQISVVDKDLADMLGVRFRTTEDFMVMETMLIPDKTPIVNQNGVLLDMYQAPSPKTLWQKLRELFK